MSSFRVPTGTYTVEVLTRVGVVVVRDCLGESSISVFGNKFWKGCWEFLNLSGFVGGPKSDTNF